MDTNEVKILIAVPCMDQVAAGFAQSLATLNKVGKCQVSFICGSLIYDARNKLAAQALQEPVNSDYVMWFDSDMTFAPGTMKKLLEDMEKLPDAGIISGLYFRRSHPYTPVAFQTLEIPEGKEAKWTDYTGKLEGIHEVGGVGFGCVLVKTSVIYECFAKYGTCFSPIGSVGEDLSFCWRAKELGYKTYLDTDIKCGHLGHIVVTEELFRALKGGKHES